MRRYIFGGMALCAAVVLMTSGCGMRKRAEKRYMRAMQEHAATIRNAAGVPEGEFRSTVASLKDIVAKYPSWERSGELQFMAGWMYANRGEYEQAREELSQVYMNFPQRFVLCSQAMYLSALTFEKQGDMKSAVKGFRQVRECYPETDAGLRAPFHLCEYYHRCGMKDECDRSVKLAVGAYCDIVGDDPDGRLGAAAQSYLLKTLALRGEWREAVTVLTKTASENAETACAPLALYLAAGICRKELGRNEEALALLERLITGYPENPLCREARLEKGMLFAERGDMARAEDACDEVRKSCRNDTSACARAMIVLGKGYIRCGRGEKGIELFERTVSLYPDTTASLDASLLAARQYQREGRVGEAGQACARAILLGRSFIARGAGKETASEACRAISSACCMQKKWPEAIAALKAFRNAFPQDNGGVAFDIGTIYLRELHDLPRARFWYSTFVNEQPGHRMAPFARKILDRTGNTGSY